MHHRVVTPGVWVASPREIAVDPANINSGRARLRAPTAPTDDAAATTDGSDHGLLIRAAEAERRARPVASHATDGVDALAPPRAQLPNWIERHGHGTMPAVVAHRGNATKSGTSGNDLASLRAAAADGSSDAVEFDMRRLRDGTIVVHHDAHVWEGPLWGRSLASLTRDELKDHPEIPTLEEFASEAGRLGVNVMAEFKETGYEAEALDVLKQHLRPDQLAVWSFSREALRNVHEEDASIPIGLVAQRHFWHRSLEHQLDDLGFTPAFVELNDTNDDFEAMATARRRDVDLMFGSGARSTIEAQAHEPDVVGFVANDPVRAAGYLKVAY
ncbi:MAG: glycerophosphodiester phosphodiesterase [Thermoleophilia bacterium]|nr:glycerophosphodiester phosphodiesterase [Thermoleophilia bacterium]